MWIVVVGNPLNGFAIYGPFDNGSTASEWANANCDQEWWTTEMLKPLGVEFPPVAAA